MERCIECGTDPGEIVIELNRLQTVIEFKQMCEIDRVRCLDLIYEIRDLVTPVNNLIRGPWGRIQ